MTLSQETCFMMTYYFGGKCNQVRLYYVSPYAGGFFLDKRKGCRRVPDTKNEGHQKDSKYRKNTIISLIVILIVVVFLVLLSIAAYYFCTPGMIGRGIRHYNTQKQWVSKVPEQLILPDLTGVEIDLRYSEIEWVNGKPTGYAMAITEIQDEKARVRYFDISSSTAFPEDTPETLMPYPDAVYDLNSIRIRYFKMIAVDPPPKGPPPKVLGRMAGYAFSMAMRFRWMVLYMWYMYPSIIPFLRKMSSIRMLWIRKMKNILAALSIRSSNNTMTSRRKRKMGKKRG